MIGIPVGLLYANAGEWLIHRYLLHDRGKHKDSAWAYHWHDHHKGVRKDDFRDPKYEVPLWACGWNARTKEAVSLSATALAHLPLFPVAPFFTATVLWSTWDYYAKHKRAHLDPDWAREHLPWHYDHHMGPDQDANWCVTHPWFDDWMGTRQPYAGSHRESADQDRRQALKAARSAAPSAA